MAVILSLAQSAYWPQQLAPLNLSYSIDPPLPTTDNVLASVPHGGSVSSQYQLPFTPTSGQGTFPIPGDSPNVPWSQMPPPGNVYQWTIQLQSVQGTVYGQVALQIVPPPQLLDLVYDGAKITALFTMVPFGSPSFYKLSVKTASGTLSGQTQTAAQTEISIPVAAPLLGSCTYTIATCGAGDLASGSGPAAMLVDLPVLMNAVYDGLKITAQWIPVPGATVYILRASSSAHGKQSYQVELPVPQGSLNAPGIDATYTFAVLAAIAPPVYSSTVEIPFLLPLPQIEEAVYNGAVVAAEWLPIGGASSYTMRAFSPQGPAYQNLVAVPEGSLPAPNLNPALPYLFTVIANGVGYVSVAAFPMPMILTFPSLQQGIYDGQNLTSNWLPVANAETYTMRAFTTGGGPSYESDTAIPQGVLPAPNLSTSVQYFYEILANIAGYVSSSAPPARILTTLPVLLKGLYDLTTASAEWTAIQNPLISGYTVRVFAAGGPSYSANTPPSSGQATVPIQTPLNPQLPYHMQLIAVVDGGVSSSTDHTMLLAQCTAQLNYAESAQQMVASWKADPDPGVTQYLVKLYRNGAMLQQQTVTTLTYSFAEILENGALFQTRVCGSNGIMFGPLSDFAAAPVALLMATQYDGFARLTQVQWALNASTCTYAYGLDYPGNITSASYSATIARRAHGSSSRR